MDEILLKLYNFLIVYLESKFHSLLTFNYHQNMNVFVHGTFIVFHFKLGIIFTAFMNFIDYIRNNKRVGFV